MSYLLLLLPVLTVNAEQSILDSKTPMHPDASTAESFSSVERRLTVGSELDYPPFALVTPKGKADGYSVDLIKAATEAMELDIHFRVGPWSEVRTALEDREIDILPLVGYSKERDEKMDFTKPHTIVYDSIFIRKGEADKFGDFKSLADLKDKKVIVLRADNANDYVTSIGIPEENIILADTNPDGMKMLSEGKYDYVLMPKLMGLLITQDLKLDNIQAYGPPVEDYTRAFCFAVKEGDVRLQTLLNDGLNIIKANGEYDKIYEKWFGALEPKGVSWRIVLEIVFSVAIVFLILLSIISIWSFSLKREVKKRTIELQDEISERKKIEVDLRKTKEEAENAYHQADSASRAKSQFLANMSHELRTPLNAILGYTQIFNRDPSLTTKQLEGIQIIQRSSEYLLTLINDILDITKAEADRTEIHPVEFNFTVFLKNVVDLFKMRAQQKGIAFIYEPLSILPTGLHADDKRLRQILINLLANAIKFTKRGGVTFKVSYDTGKIHFQIEDTGEGIAEEYIDAIFQPFHQVGDWRHHAEGAGLGLAITQKLVNLMGGELKVKSHLGKGSTFEIILALPEVKGLKVMNTQEQQPLVIGYEGKKRRILVVDDKWENRSVLMNLLSPLGFEVIEANNGQEGLNKLVYEAPPDLVITDLVMPVMDGFEFTRQVRNITPLKELPIITASASVFEYAQEKSTEVGCNDFVPKPIRAEELIQLLGVHLDIVWKYNLDHEEDGKNVVDNRVETESNPSEFSEDETYPLSLEQAEILLDLGMQGDIYGCMDYAKNLSQTCEQLKPFANKIIQLAQNIDSDKICELVQPYLQK